jgi:hypothetical protein
MSKLLICNIQEHFLKRALCDPKNRLAGRLQNMIEKLAGTSLDRAEFEEELRRDSAKNH